MKKNLIGVSMKHYTGVQLFSRHGGITRYFAYFNYLIDEQNNKVVGE